MQAQKAIQLLYPSAQRAVVPVMETPLQAPANPGRPEVADGAMSAAKLLELCPPPEYEAFPRLHIDHGLAMAILRTQRLLLRRGPLGLRLEGDTTLIGVLLGHLDPTTELHVEWLEADTPVCSIPHHMLIARPLDASLVEAHLRDLTENWGAKGDIREMTAAVLGISKEGLRKRRQRGRTAK